VRDGRLAPVRVDAVELQACVRRQIPRRTQRAWGGRRSVTLPHRDARRARKRAETGRNGPSLTREGPSTAGS
jgi:hypothetical protein